MLFGLSLPAIVGLLIEILKKVGIIVTGDQARIANLVLSALGALAVSLMGEFNFQVPQIVIVIVAAVYSVVVSALGYSAGEKVVERFIS